MKHVQHRLKFAKLPGPRPLTDVERKGRGSKVRHRVRAHREARCPIHVTVRLREGLPSLRSVNAHRTLVQAFRESADQFGFRLVHYSIQSSLRRLRSGPRRSRIHA